MKNDYLWEGSGEADPELQRVEQSLARFRYNTDTREMPNFVAARAAYRKPSLFASLTTGWAPRFAAF